MLANNNLVYYDNTTHTLLLKSIKFSELNNLFCHINNLFIKSLEHYFLKKIKFAGKSFRVEKLNQNKETNKSIFFYKFGHSYKTFVFLKNIKQKHLKKTKIFFLSTNILLLRDSLYKIQQLRNWNIYTQRGIRLGKQKILKKPGKKSSFA